jgi:hypothetical protein
MKKNKKIPVSILLLSFYAMFMYQEIMINQVLCFKDNGDADVELAIFGFQCECKKVAPHTHLNHTETSTLLQLCGKCFDCFDLPLDNTWLKRNITNNNLEINFVKQCDLVNHIYLQLDYPFIGLPESVPKSKFLYNILSPVDSVVFRC